MLVLLLDQLLLHVNTDMVTGGEGNGHRNFSDRNSIDNINSFTEQRPAALTRECFVKSYI